jgi:hypothetical protein
MRSIINNKLDYSILPEHLQDEIYFEMHKMAFSKTLYVLNTINSEMLYMNNFLITNVKLIENDVYEYNGEYYNYILIKYLFNNKIHKKYIQEIGEIEFD